jgi:outer membrane lipoprotein-sorting protein
MQRITLFILAGHLFLMGVNLPVTAAGAPETADEVIQFCITKSAELETWSGKMSQKMSVFGGEMQATGQMTFKRPSLMQMQLSMPIMGNQSVMNMKTVIGPDKIMWQEMDLGGKKQVIKMNIEAASANASKMGMKVDALQNLDPTKQWEQNKRHTDYSLAGAVEINGIRTYILEGKWKKEALLNQQTAPMTAIMGKSRIYIGQTDGFMYRMEQFDSSNTNVVITLEFTDLKFNEPIPDTTFQYSPPPNVNITDMTQAMENQLRNSQNPKPQDESQPAE